MSNSPIDKLDARDLIHHLVSQLNDQPYTSPYEISQRIVELMLKKDLIEPLEAVQIFESTIKDDLSAREWLERRD